MQTSATTAPPPAGDPVEVALVVLWRVRGGRREVLLTRRGEGVHLAGQWELPGGKIEPGESVEQAARREALEEVGLAVGPVEHLAGTEHRYPDRTVRLHAVLAGAEGQGRARNLGVADHRWVPVGELARHPLPPANGPITDAVVRRLG